MDAAFAEQMKLLRKEARKRNRIVEDNVGNGDCLFHSVSTLLGVPCEEVRKSAVASLRAFPTLVRQLNMLIHDLIRL
jgi:hypothetical protein